MRTSAENVYAIGDLVPGPALAHKASDEGIIAVEDAAGKDRTRSTTTSSRRATFCHPQVASFGLTEKEAKEAGHDVVVGKVPSAPSARRPSTATAPASSRSSATRSTASCLAATSSAQGRRPDPGAGERARLEGGYPEVARIVHGHPTFAEAVMEAARAADGWLIHG